MPSGSAGSSSTLAGEPADDVDYTGDQLTVTWGREHIQPIQFNGCDVGPFSMTVMIGNNESPAQAAARAMRWLDCIAAEEMRRKIPEFLSHVREADRVTRAEAAGERS